MISEYGPSLTDNHLNIFHGDPSRVSLSQIILTVMFSPNSAAAKPKLPPIMSHSVTITIDKNSECCVGFFKLTYKSGVFRLK